jgi:hypothetical protein
MKHESTQPTQKCGATTLTETVGHAKPETFRLPKNGVDPHFGLTRPFYYELEKQGRLRLIRLKKRGRQRGITLVPYDDVKRLIEEARG